MTDGFPSHHTTTTTTTTTVGPAPGRIHYDPAYVRMVPGYLKIICMVLDLIGFICITMSVFRYHSRGEFFNTVAMIGLWFTGIMLGFYVFHVVDRYNRIPWLKIEMYFCAVITILYMLASALVASFGSEAFQAAAFFGFCAMLAYGYDAFKKFTAVRAGFTMETARTVSPQSPVTTLGA